MLRREGHDAAIRQRLCLTDALALSIQAGKRLLSGFEHLKSDARQRDRVSRPVHEHRSSPELDRLDAAAKCRLAQIAALRRLRKTSRSGKMFKISEPRQVHWATAMRLAHNVRRT